MLYAQLCIGGAAGGFMLAHRIAWAQDINKAAIRCTDNLRIARQQGNHLGLGSVRLCQHLALLLRGRSLGGHACRPVPAG